VVTSNRNKADEIASFFDGTPPVVHAALECPEYRSDDVGEIARQKAIYAYSHLRRPLIVDDTSFSVCSLQGFPGTYAAYVQQTIGNAGILRLLSGIEDRRAYFETAVGFSANGEVWVFRGRVDGRIVEPRGERGFGYDPIFEWEGRTFAELSPEEKSRISHRARALSALREWLAAEQLL
jgi:XTP/dITP diphosphohydrolase